MATTIFRLLAESTLANTRSMFGNVCSVRPKLTRNTLTLTELVSERSLLVLTIPAERKILEPSMDRKGSYHHDRARGKHKKIRSSSSSSSNRPASSPRSDGEHMRRHNDNRSRSPRNRGNSVKQLDEDCRRDGKSVISRDAKTSEDKHTSFHKSCPREDSGYGDECDNQPAGTSSSVEKSITSKCGRAHQSARKERSSRKSSRGNKDQSKKLPWVPPPLPEHLRQIPQVTKVGNPFPPAKNYFCPLQNQFQNDGSFLEVFRQRMQAANTLQVSGETSPSHSAELSSLATASKEPVVMKRRMLKPLKTGMVQKPKKRVDACDPEVKNKDSWSLYMKEVQKYRANKCINSEACRPLMK